MNVATEFTVSKTLPNASFTVTFFASAFVDLMVVVAFPLTSVVSEV